MVDTRKITRGSEAEKRVREPRTTNAAAIPGYSDAQLSKAAAKVQRTFLDIPLEEAKQVLIRCELDPKKAVATLKARQQLIEIEDDAVSAGSLNGAKAPVKRGGNLMKRRAPDLSTANNIMVQITVISKGQPQTFAIHKSFICDASPYFHAAFNSWDLFVERQTQHMNISFTTPEIFGLFQNWIYYNKITDFNNKFPSIPQMVELWILAAKFRTPALQNLAIRGLFGKSFCDGSDGCPDALKSFNYIYHRTSPGDALRRLFIDIVISRRMPDQALTDLLDNHWDDIPKELLKDLIVVLKKSQQAAQAVNSLLPLKLGDYLVSEQRGQD